jgi:bacterioferritin
MKLNINKKIILNESVLQQTEQKLLQVNKPDKIFTPTNSKELNASGLRNLFSGQKSSDTYMARMSKHASDQSLGKSSSLNESTQINNANTILNLQKAFGDEFNTVYQYFIQANILEYSQNYNSIVKELKQHGMEEYHHAKLIANRIKELGGKVDPNPLKALQINTCGYIEPHNPDSYDIVNMAFNGEECVIQTYTKMANEAYQANDIVTYDMLMKIIEDEQDHSNELQDIIKKFNLKPQGEKL